MLSQRERMMQRSLNTIFALIIGPFLLGFTGRNQAQLALSDDFCSGQIDSLPPSALPGTRQAAPDSYDQHSLWLWQRHIRPAVSATMSMIRTSMTLVCVGPVRSRSPRRSKNG